MDALSAFEKGFREQLGAFWHRHEELGQLPAEEAERLGSEAARTAVAPVLWRLALGDLWETRQVVDLLGVSRQAIHQRVRNGSMLGLRSRGKTLFPVWQFDFDHHDVRPIVPALLAAFRAASEVEPWVVASWATTPQPELHGQTPADLLAKQAPSEFELLAAARHSAARLAE